MSLSSLESELDRVLENQLIQTLFQPIIDTEEATIEGFEALSRGPSDSPLHPAPVLFETAERGDRSLALENECLYATHQAWQSTHRTQTLFVNVSPDNLMPDHFDKRILKALLNPGTIPPEGIVIELSERYPAANMEELKRSLKWLKSKGLRVALDDLGAGYSGLKLWSEVEPDYVKIDRHFISDIHEDLVKREFVRSVMQLSQRLNCRVIAEGVERHRELEVLQDLGVRYIQGFLFGRPKPIATANMEPLSHLKSGRRPGSRLSAGSLMHYVETLRPDNTLGEAWEHLQAQPGVFALPVVDHAGHARGLVHKWQILEIFGTNFGRALHEKTVVEKVMASDTLVFEADTSLEELSQKLTADDDDYLRQHFLVTRNGLYEGMGATRALLRQITDQRIEKARHSNPLTGLPGNVPIQKEIERRLGAEQRFYLLYFDISAFKPLNDHLGFATGDRLIVLLGDQLQRHFNQREDMIGHLGGDDFIVFTHDSHHAVEASGVVKQRFDTECLQLYPEQTREMGFIEAEDRNGQPRSWPLAYLAAGIIEVTPDTALDVDSVVEQAADAKQRAKKWGESTTTRLHLQLTSSSLDWHGMDGASANQAG